MLPWVPSPPPRRRASEYATFFTLRRAGGGVDALSLWPRARRARGLRAAPSGARRCGSAKLRRAHLSDSSGETTCTCWQSARTSAPGGEAPWVRAPVETRQRYESTSAQSRGRRPPIKSSIKDGAWSLARFALGSLDTRESETETSRCIRGSLPGSRNMAENKHGRK